MDNEPLFESKKSKQYLLVKFKSSIKLYEKTGVHASAYDHWRGSDDITVTELTADELEHRLLTTNHKYESNININVEGSNDVDKFKEVLRDSLNRQMMFNESELLWQGARDDDQSSDNEDQGEPICRLR